MFKKAERKIAKLRLALIGPSGAGKTYSALLIAKGLSGKIAMIDTERGSGSLYADLANYDVLQINPPFTPQKYVDAIHAAEKAGYEVLIIDSLSHAWSGPGGVLEIQDKVAKSTRNSFSAWREVTPQHNLLVDTILAAACHVIVTMRTKTAYEVVTEGGKTKVSKVGTNPVQREGMEYEFTVVMDLSIDGHVASASKDRTSLFDGAYFTPGAETGLKLMGWLNSGAAEAPDSAEPQQPKQDAPDPSFWLRHMHQLFEGLRLEALLGEYFQYVQDRYKVLDINDLTKDQWNEQLTMLRQCLGSPTKKEKFVDILSQWKMAA